MLRRLIPTAVVATALVAATGAAQANQSSHRHARNQHAQNHSQHGRCGVVKRGFVVSGDTLTADAGTPAFPTQNTDGTYSSPADLMFTARHANRHAHRSGVVTNGQPVSLALENTRVTFVGVTDSATDANDTVGFEDVLPTDLVKARGKIPYAKKGGHGDKACPNPFPGDSRYDADGLSIRKVVVIRETPEQATP